MSQSKIPAVISALVVLAVLGLLGFMLSNRSVEPELAESTSDSETIEEAGDTGEADILDQTTGDTGEVAPVPTFEAPPTPEIPAPDVPEQGEEIEGRPAFTIEPEQNYIATIATPRGDIVIELRPDLAPQTVNSFVALAEEGFYDGLTWHRVIDGFMAQGGDPTGTGTGGADYNLPAEFTNQVLFDRPGIVAMARANDPNSASSQFFITTAPAEHLNYQYTVFGEVIEGQDIVEGIPLRDPAIDTDPGEEIVSITIEEGEAGAESE